MTFHIHVFGCQMNVAEAAWLERALLARGLRKAPLDEAQALIVITCSVRDKPEQKVYSLLGRWKKLHRHDPRVFAAVGGCVAQQIGTGFWGRFDFVRLVFGTDGLANAPEAIARLMREPDTRISLLDFQEEPVELPLHVEEDPVARYNNGRAYVSIMQGCDNFCAYCIVPYVRGRQKSRKASAVLQQCQALADRGVREITLLGQNVNSYGQDAAARAAGENTSFARLLRQVAAIEGVERVRFTTSHPKDLDQEVIQAFGEVQEICPHLHLPMQSGSDRILQAMGRKYDMQRYMDIVQALRRARPDIALTTDLIVGFPGETEDDFAKTLAAMREVEFSGSFSFMYCDRPGVRSEKLTPKVAQEDKARRLETLQQLQEVFSRQALDRAVGSDGIVLLEGPSRVPGRHSQADGRLEPAPCSWQGRDGHNRVVNLAAPGGAHWQPGQLLKASILEAKKHSLFGEAKGEPW